MDYLEKAKRWKESKALPSYLQEELATLDDEQLKEAFYCDLEFGTGGLRGIMGVGTNRMNVIMIKKATLGYGRFLLNNVENCKERGVVIAHDNRMHGEDFTEAAAAVLANLGIKVYVFPSLRPTPELSFAVRYMHAAGGIVITASHNPKEYNGYKIYNDQGCQLVVSQSDIVLEEIGKIEDELAIDETHDEELIETLGPGVDKAFVNLCASVLLRPEMDRSDLSVVYTPQHGAGYVPVMETLKAIGIKVTDVKEQAFPSDTFENTKCPNPEVHSAYDLGFEYLEKTGADFLVTTDPDSDRMGIALINKDGEKVYLTGNQTSYMLIQYVADTYLEKGKNLSDYIIYNTIVTSPLGEKITRSYGIAFEQTLTGFKNIGEKIALEAKKPNPKKFLMGYEESYGYLFTEEVRDKDAVSSIALICEMASYYKKQGKTLDVVLKEVQDKYGYVNDYQKALVFPGITGAQKIKDMMSMLREKNVSEIAGNPLTCKEDYLNLTKVTKEGTTSFEFEKSNVLRYVFEDGSFIAVRPSGTEPKCKFYFLVYGKTPEQAEARRKAIEAEVLSWIE